MLSNRLWLKRVHQDQDCRLVDTRVANPRRWIAYLRWRGVTTNDVEMLTLRSGNVDESTIGSASD